MSIELNNVALTFVGDGQTREFDVNIEGVAPHRDRYEPFALFTVTNVISNPEGTPPPMHGPAGDRTMLRYGVDYTYTANGENENAAHNLFYNSFTVNLFNPLPAGVVLVAVRTTAVRSISRYTMDKTPPRQVELDFDNVIKILQEQGYTFDSILKWIEWANSEFERIHDEFDDVLHVGDPVSAHAPQHAEDGIDPVTPEMIGALREAPSDGNIYAATTAEDGTPGWVRLFNQNGYLTATVVVQTFFFTGDGVSTEFGVSIAHTLNTDTIQAIVYDDDTGTRVHFPTTVPDRNTIVLNSAIAYPAGRKFRCMLYGNGRIDPAWFKDVVKYPQETPATEWVINHGMHNSTPIVLVLNKDNPNQIEVPEIDYANATPDSITLRFFKETAGTAVLYGWVGEVVAFKRAPYYEKFENATDLVLNHNLGEKKPTVLVLAPGNVVVTPDIDYEGASLDQIVLHFAVPQTGEAWIGVR